MYTHWFPCLNTNLKCLERNQEIFFQKRTYNKYTPHGALYAYMFFNIGTLVVPHYKHRKAIFGYSSYSQDQWPAQLMNIPAEMITTKHLQMVNQSSVKVTLNELLNSYLNCNGFQYSVKARGSCGLIPNFRFSWFLYRISWSLR